MCRVEGWDWRHAREVLGVGDVLGVLVAKMGPLVRMRENDGLKERKEDVFARYTRHASFLKRWYETMSVRGAEDIREALYEGFDGGGLDMRSNVVLDLDIRHEPFMGLEDGLGQSYSELAEWMITG